MMNRRCPPEFCGADKTMGPFVMHTCRPVGRDPASSIISFTRVSFLIMGSKIDDADCTYGDAAHPRFLQIITFYAGKIFSSFSTTASVDVADEHGGLPW